VPLLQHGQQSQYELQERQSALNVVGYKFMGLFYAAGSHDVEVSSGVHSRKRSARSPSRLSRKAATSNADEESSSLQTLAAAADSGKLDPRPTVTLAVDLWCMLQALLRCAFVGSSCKNASANAGLVCIYAVRPVEITSGLLHCRQCIRSWGSGRCKLDCRLAFTGSCEHDDCGLTAA